MKKSLINEFEARIRFSELDPLGVVWHGNYFKYFEDGREALAKQYGLDYLTLYNKGIVIPVVNCSSEFKSPLFYGNKMKIVTHFINTAAAKLIHHYEIWNLATDKLSATGQTTQIFLDKDRGELQLTFPEYFLEWKKSNELA